LLAMMLLLIDPHMSRRPAVSADRAASNIRTIVELEAQARGERDWQERVSDRIAAIAGTVTFVLFHLGLFIGWAAWNALAPQGLRFDPYPYGLLTFVVSLEGVLIATFVLIKQNRMSRQADARDHLNLQVDLLAEQEVTVMLRMLRRISERLGVPADENDAREAEQLAEETNVYELMRNIETQMPLDDKDKDDKEKADT
jgi:uncharacterized membrane protein